MNPEVDAFVGDGFQGRPYSPPPSADGNPRRRRRSSAESTVTRSRIRRSAAAGIVYVTARGRTVWGRENGRTLGDGSCGQQRQRQPVPAVVVTRCCSRRDANEVEDGTRLENDCDRRWRHVRSTERERMALKQQTFIQNDKHHVTSDMKYGDT